MSLSLLAANGYMICTDDDTVSADAVKSRDSLVCEFFGDQRTFHLEFEIILTAYVLSVISGSLAMTLVCCMKASRVPKEIRKPVAKPEAKHGASKGTKSQQTARVIHYVTCGTALCVVPATVL